VKLLIAGAATTLTSAVPADDETPSALVATQLKVRVPADPAVNVIEVVPAPAVMVPPVMPQVYEHPVWAGMLAANPVLPVVTVAGALITGINGAATTVTVVELDLLPSAADVAVIV
jgi:hypothetical protein